MHCRIFGGIAASAANQTLVQVQAQTTDIIFTLESFALVLPKWINNNEIDFVNLCSGLEDAASQSAIC